MTPVGRFFDAAEKKYFAFKRQVLELARNCLKVGAVGGQIASQTRVIRRGLLSEGTRVA